MTTCHYILTAEEQVKKLLVRQVRRMLGKTDQNHRQLFDKLYPGPLEDLTEDQLRSAYRLVRATLLKIRDGRV